MTPKTKLSDLEDEYRNYLRQVRALTPSTIAGLVGIFRRFARFLSAKRCEEPAQLTLELAYKFFTSSLGQCGRHFIYTMHSGIKSVFRFLYFTQVLPEDYSNKMLTPRIWRLADLPKGFSDESMRIILQAVQTCESGDYRDPAMIHLLLHYGLRPREVVRLELDDIDWQQKTIAIRRRKNIKPLLLPLLPPVENALRNYIEQMRPADIPTNNIFVALKSPHCPLLPAGLRKCVGDFLRRYGLKGYPYNFRHTLATRLINEGVSLHDIQEILGHRTCRSTMVYAKVNLQALREVAENDSLLL